MLSHSQAQELHECITQAAGQSGDHLVALERAQELAAIMVADTAPSPVSYAPCITGKIEAGGAVSEFLLPLDRDDVGFSQWGAPNETLWQRVGLLDTLSGSAKEWWAENKPEEGEDDE